MCKDRAEEIGLVISTTDFFLKNIEFSFEHTSFVLVDDEFVHRPVNAVGRLSETNLGG